MYCLPNEKVCSSQLQIFVFNPAMSCPFKILFFYSYSTCQQKENTNLVQKCNIIREIEAE